MFYSCCENLRLPIILESTSKEESERFFRDAAGAMGFIESRLNFKACDVCVRKI